MRDAPVTGTAPVRAAALVVTKRRPVVMRPWRQLVPVQDWPQLVPIDAVDFYPRRRGKPSR